MVDVWVLGWSDETTQAVYGVYATRQEALDHVNEVFDFMASTYGRPKGHIDRANGRHLVRVEEYGENVREEIVDTWFWDNYWVTARQFTLGVGQPEWFPDGVGLTEPR